jgi:hypothetical protein
MRILRTGRPLAVVTVALLAVALAQALLVLPGRARYEWSLIPRYEPGRQPKVLAPLRNYFRKGSEFFVRARAEIPPHASYGVFSHGDALRLAAPYVLLPRRQVDTSKATWILSNVGTPASVRDRVIRRISLGNGVLLLELRRP